MSKYLLPIASFFLVGISSCQKNSDSNLLSLPPVDGFSGFDEVTAKTLPLPFKDFDSAVGVFEMHPFADKGQSVSCTAFYIGDGLAVTAGHCLLGSQVCNDSSIRFGVRKDKAATQISTCVEVIYSRSDDARLTGPHEDVALLRISNPPEHKLEINFVDRPTTGTPLIMLSYLRPQKGTANSLWLSSRCQVTASMVVNDSGVALPSSTFLHDCGQLGGSDGAPLINARNGQVVGIAQSQSLVNVNAKVLPKNVKDVSRQNFAKYMAGSYLKQALYHDSNTAPFKVTDIWIGHFPSEVLPGGFASPLKFQLAQIGEEGERVSFRYRTGTDTTLKVEDGLGFASILGGIPIHSKRKQVTFVAPIKIWAETYEKTYTLGAAVEDVKVTSGN